MQSSDYSISRNSTKLKIIFKKILNFSHIIIMKIN